MDKREQHRPANWGAGRALLIRIATTIAGVFLFIYGIIAAISPLPLGVPLAVIALFMIAGANPAFRPVIREIRARFRWFDRLVDMVEPRTSGVIHDVIEETDPDGHTKPHAAPDTSARKGSE